MIFVSDSKGELIDNAELSIIEDNPYDSIRILKSFGEDQYNKLVEYKRDDNMKAYAIVPEIHKNGKATCGEGVSGEGVSYPAHVVEFAHQTSGKQFSICENTWGDNLNIISNDLRVILQSSYFLLEEVPLADTIQVFFNDYELPNDVNVGWYYNPETISIYIGADFDYYKYANENGENNYKILYHPLNPGLFYKRNPAK